MLEKICVYQNRVFVQDLSSFLVAFEYSKSDSQAKFRESFKLKIPLPLHLKVKDVFLATVENYSIGLKCMIIIVINENDEVATFMYCSALRNSIFSILHVHFNLPSIEVNANLFLTHGPILTILHQNELQIYALCHKVKKCLNLGAILDVYESFKVMQCSSIGQLVTSDICVMLLVLDCDKTHIEIFTIAINMKNSDLPAVWNKVKLSHFFSMPFHNIAKSVAITNVTTSKWTIFDLKNASWVDNCTYVCTTANCLVFSSGSLKHVCQLPIPDIYWSIKLHFCQISSNNVFLVSENKDVYLLDKMPSTTELKIIKSWTDINCVLSGELMLNEMKCLFLFRDCSLNTWQDGCILCDISSEFPVDITGQNSVPAAAVAQTIPVIRANIEAGKLAIAEAELEISRKIGATLDALYRIKNQVPEKDGVTHHISSFQESLLDILLCSDKQLTKNSGETIVPLTLQKHWKKIINRRFALCWTFTNENEKPFCYPTIKIFIQNQYVNCIQKVFVHKLSTFSIDDECRDIIHPTEKFSVLVQLEIPKFQPNTIQIDAILCGFMGQSIDYILPLEENNFTHHQQLLQTSISFSDGVCEEYKDISTLEDLACLRVVQQRTVLRVSSLSNLSDLEKYFISGTDGVRNFLFLEGASKQTLVFKNALSPFYGVSITFQASQDAVELETFTRNDQETLLLVKYLYERLPEDVVILPCGLTTSEQSELKQQVVCAMKEEIDLLLTGIHINAIQQFDNKDSLLIARNKFFKVRNAVSRKEAITDNLLQTLYQINLLSASTSSLK